MKIEDARRCMACRAPVLYRRRDGAAVIYNRAPYIYALTEMRCRRTKELVTYVTVADALAESGEPRSTVMLTLDNVFEIKEGIVEGQR